MGLTFVGTGRYLPPDVATKTSEKYQEAARRLIA